jgi:hypothetical protein
MLKRMVSMVLTAGIVILPAMLIGCEKDEIRTQKTVVVEDKVVDQHEVVE